MTFDNDPTKRTYRKSDDIDQFNFSIEGHAVEQAYGTYYTDQGFNWCVVERRHFGMGCGTAGDPILYVTSKEHAEQIVTTLEPTIGLVCHR